MRRHTRTVRRKRFLEVLGERDMVGSTIPGLACGVLAVGIALFASELGRGRAAAQGYRAPDAAASGTSAVASGTAAVSSGVPSAGAPSDHLPSAKLSSASVPSASVSLGVSAGVSIGASTSSSTHATHTSAAPARGERP